MSALKEQRERDKARKAEEKVLRELKARIQQFPNDAKGYNYLGVFYSKKGNCGEALKYFTKAITLKPKNASYYNNRGNVYSMQKLYEKALDDYNHAITLNPNNASYYNNQGNVYSSQKLYEKALDSYNQAIALTPNNASYYNNRGGVYLEQKLYVKALDDYNKAIKLNPNLSPAYASRAVLNAKLKDYTAAQQDFEKAAELEPDQKLLFSQMLENYQLKDQLEQANQKQQQLVRDFNHWVGNHLFPERLTRVADILKNTYPDSQDEQLELLEAAEQEQLMRLTSNMLRIRHRYSSDPKRRNQEFRSLIAGDRNPEMPPCSTFPDILNSSLKIAVRDFFEHPNLNKTRAAHADAHNYSLKARQQHYQKQVLLGEIPIIDWIDQYLITDFQVTVNPTWQAIQIKKLNYAEAVLRNILFELFFNLFKYGDFQHVHLSFTETTEDDIDYLVVHIRNTYQNNKSIGSQAGLEALRDELQQINNDVDTLEIHDDSQKKVFTLSFKLDKFLFTCSEAIQTAIDELNKLFNEP